MPGRRKVTVRVDEELWEAFSAFCEHHGVSRGAMLQATAWRTATRYDLHGRRPMEEWPDPREREALTAIIGYARELDAARRAR